MNTIRFAASILACGAVCALALAEPTTPKPADPNPKPPASLEPAKPAAPKPEAKKPESVKPATEPAAAKKESSVLDFTVKSIDGKDVDLSRFKGKVVLIVNTASKCGMTPQYKGLEQLYKDKKDAGLVVLGFPANNFMGQEPGSDSDIKQFCESTYNVTFPMFSKLSVKGADIAPLYKALKADPSGGEPDWNFAKFLVGRDGKLVKFFKAPTKPDNKDLVAAITEQLAKKVP